MGDAVASGTTSIRNRVLCAKPGVGLMATQAYTNIACGDRGLKLFAKGFTQNEVLDRLLREDSEIRGPGKLQLCILTRERLSSQASRLKNLEEKS